MGFLVAGDTYPHRVQLYKLGGDYDRAERVWRFASPPSQPLPAGLRLVEERASATTLYDAMVYDLLESLLDQHGTAGAREELKTRLARAEAAVASSAGQVAHYAAKGIRAPDLAGHHRTNQEGVTILRRALQLLA